MSAPPATNVSRFYAIQLLAAEHPGDDRLVGRIEHVLSGRRCDFGDGTALLACLAEEQSLASATDGAVAAAEAR